MQIWRDWQQTRPANVTLLESRSYSGQPIAIAADVPIPSLTIPVYEGPNGLSSECIGLVLPTSLCSGQIARMTTDTLNAEGAGQAAGLTRFATLVHTEGCGGTVVPEYKDTILSYLQHPKVRHALLLEHGCEITHNSYFRTLMAERGLSPGDFGWASIQLDGGIDAVMRKMVDWFRDRLRADMAPKWQSVGVEALRIGILTQGALTDDVARELARLSKMIVAGGGSVVVSQQDALLESGFGADLDIGRTTEASIGYGQRARRSGFHIMANPRGHWGETLAGYGRERCRSSCWLLSLATRLPGIPWCRCCK